MGKQLLDSLVAVATAIIGVAIISVLVSGNSKTVDVIKAAGSAFSGAVQAATNPGSGSSNTFNPSGGASSLLGNL